MSSDSPVKEKEPGTVDCPPFSLIDSLCKDRERAFGSTGSSLLTSTGQERLPTSGGSTADIARRSKTIRNREIRLRRMLMIEPRIPDAYAMTTQRVRAGQSLLADMALRLPSALLDKPYAVHVEPYQEDDDSRANAEEIQEFLHAFFLGLKGKRALIDNGRVSVWRLFMDNLCNTGEGIFSLMERRDKWSEYANPRVPRLDQFSSDGEATARSNRKTASEKYNLAKTTWRRQVPPFSTESLDPQMVYLVEDYDGREDEAVIVQQRPYRPTLVQYGLMPSGHRYGTDIVKSGDKQRGYFIGPNGLGKPYPVRDFPTGRYLPENVEVVHYYCSAERAQALGLTDGKDPDLGVWATYVDGVAVAYGGLWGPFFHPLPIFSSAGLPTAIPDPNYSGVPVLMHLIELADLFDQIFTMELHIAFWSAFPPVIEEDKTTSSGGAVGLPTTAELDPEAIQRPGQQGAGGIKYLEPAKFYQVPTGKTWRYFVMPPEATAHMERLYEKAQALWNLLGLPGEMRGQGGAQQPGYAIAQLMMAARALFNPLVDNSTTLVAQACKYLLWQVWRRFPEGISVYANKSGARDAGVIHITPDMIAPDGVPWLELTVSADPLMPVDEALLEKRGQDAVQTKMKDRMSAMETYYKDPSPEKTMARIIAQQAQEHPVAVANAVYRTLVRSQELLPQMAVAMYAKDFGVSPEDALGQLVSAGALTMQQGTLVEQLLQARAQAAQAAQVANNAAGAGGPPQVGPAPGAPNLPQPAPTTPLVPTPPAPPMAGIGGGAGLPMAPTGRLPAPSPGGQPPLLQPTVASRQAAAVR